ncbi:MAG: hypothetical protein GY835_11640 [bacterium]|nr:hypothetical protein [bacterium]
MITKRSFFLVLPAATLMSLAASIVVNNLDNPYTHPRSTLTATSQNSRDRAWQDVTYRKLLEIGDSEQGFLYGPLYLKVGYDDHLFVADYGVMKIKEFSPHGQYIRAYGTDRGQGPGELSSIPDFIVTKGDEIWVADDSNGRIVVFDRSGKVLRYIKMQFPPHRIAVSGRGDEFTAVILIGLPSLFGQFDDTGTLVRHFGDFIENHEMNSLALQGWVISDPIAGFSYTGKYASFIASYDRHGGLRFLVETIDSKPVPKIVRNSRGWKFVDKDAQINARSLSATAGKLHLLTPIQDGFMQIGSIDTYDSSDGTYLYSRRIPEPCQYVVVREDCVYTVSDATITKWAIQSWDAK